MNKIDGFNLIMKSTDKITMTIGQLKRLVKESSHFDEWDMKTEAKDEPKAEKTEDQVLDILDKIIDYSKLAGAYIDLSVEDKNSPAPDNLFKDAIQSVLFWSHKLEKIYDEKVGGSEV
jgi:hypothetical protein